MREKGEPIALIGLEMTSASDKLTERQMAAEFGITCRALQGRRYRGQIPEGVWMKTGRTTYYSRQKYDQWLESVWPSGVVRDIASPNLRRRGAAKLRAPFPFLV